MYKINYLCLYILVLQRRNNSEVFCVPLWSIWICTNNIISNCLCLILFTVLVLFFTVRLQFWTFSLIFGLYSFCKNSLTEVFHSQTIALCCKSRLICSFLLIIVRIYSGKRWPLALNFSGCMQHILNPQLMDWPQSCKFCNGFVSWQFST